ncbi:hypothetical protein ACQEU8_00455 [Streptomyces sp. CA-250714]|uniref:hypothetical protein n=1 Tax=Streptomyces sp. CA-250714 TaxID=3240060 RepID=UPI003D8C2FCB
MVADRLLWVRESARRPRRRRTDPQGRDHVLVHTDRKPSADRRPQRRRQPTRAGMGLVGQDPHPHYPQPRLPRAHRRTGRPVPTQRRLPRIPPVSCTAPPRPAGRQPHRTAKTPSAEVRPDLDIHQPQ